MWYFLIVHKVDRKSFSKFVIPENIQKHTEGTFALYFPPLGISILMGARDLLILQKADRKIVQNV